jgi:hypothetical protein
MITGDPINDDIQWLLQELKQVDKDLEAVTNYWKFIERGNTVSVRYDAIDEESEMSWDMPNYLEKQLAILNNARENILFELECLDESYLEKTKP